MRFHQDTTGGNIIQAYSDRGIMINDRLISTSVVITPDSVEAWSAQTVSGLEAHHLEPLLARRPGVIILGTGASIVFPPPSLLAGIQQRGIGIEVMANDAAIRTFNVLVSEDRRVVLALLQGGA